MDYNDIFQGLKHQLTTLSKTSTNTPDFTKAIVSFFREKYNSSYIVRPDEGKSEYLYDICIMDFDPLDIYKNDKASYKIYLFVESELGGPSATSAKLIEKNVIEVFFKILQADAENKIFVGIYSSNQNESWVLENRIRKMFEISQKTDNQVQILIVLIEGEHSEDSRHRQVKIKNPLNINGFLMTSQNYAQIIEQ